jgi:Icc-related predicted phosphoesterase
MRIVAISDTHGLHRAVDIPDGDVLVHAGDCLRLGNFAELRDFCDWYSKQPHRYKVLVAGNHDGIFQTEFHLVQSLIPDNITYLQDSSVSICGKVFYGAPWTPVFFDWAFMKVRGESMARVWANIPDDVDVLVTHGPAFGQGDLAPPYKTRHPRTTGCLELLKRIQETQPKLHIYGHIHAGHGITQSDALPMTTFINASISTEKYAPTNKPIVIDIQ